MKWPPTLCWTAPKTINGNRHFQVKTYGGKNDWRFNECSIIVNLEPCTMCAAALVQARMGQVIYGTEDDKRGGFGGTIDLSKHESAHHKMKVVGGILNQDCKNKIKLWFKKMRNQK